MDNKADKLWKKTLREQQKRLKPGECEKYVRLVLDDRIMALPLGQELLPELNKTDLKYEIRKLPEPKCIIWERSIGQHILMPGTSPSATVSSTSNNLLDDEWQKDKQVVRLLTAHELQEATSNSAVQTIGESLRAAFPEMRHTILIPMRLKDTKSKCSSTANALIELQILQQIAVLHVSNTYELVALLRRFTKAIAETTYKQQKAEQIVHFKKFLANDKKQCVRVEGSNGFGRLWQQHLTRLPMVTLEVAETIIAQYSCPRKLLREFNRNDDAENALADLKISRGGPEVLQTDRRIGNVLSSKMYTVFTARDPNTLV